MGPWEERARFREFGQQRDILVAAYGRQRCATGGNRVVIVSEVSRSGRIVAGRGVLLRSVLRIYTLTACWQHG